MEERFTKVLIVCAVAIAIVLSGGLLVDGCSGTVDVIDGEVIEWDHRDAETRLVTRYHTDSDGDTYTTLETEHIPERWSVVVHASDGEVFSREVRSAQWYLYKTRPKVFVKVTTGKWTGLRYYGLKGPATSVAESQ